MWALEDLHCFVNLMFFILNNLLKRKARLFLVINIIGFGLLIQNFIPLYSSGHEGEIHSSSSSSSSSSGSSMVLSSSSSSGSVIVQVVSNQTNTSSSGAFCSSGLVSCKSGFVATCSDPGYIPTCLPGVQTNIIDCCKNNGISLDCKSQFPLCKVPVNTSSSSSSGLINSGAYCQDGMVLCSGGSLAACSDQTYTPKCLPGFNSIDSFECCKTNGIALLCKPELAVTCPDISVTSPQNQFQTVTIDIVSNPTLPDIIELPIATDAFVNRSGFAYIGSNPSFEIKLPADDPDITIASVDLKDSSGFIYKNIHFTVTPISGQPERYILNLSIPDSIKEGETKFGLNLNDGTSFNGVIYVFNPLEISVFKGKSIKTRRVSKPLITRVSISKIKNRVILNVKGDNFVGRSFLYKDKDNVDNLVQNPKGMPNTKVTIFPLSLKAEIKKVSVFNHGTEMKIIIDFPFSVVAQKTDAELIVSTPSGIASHSFALKSEIGSPTKPVTNLQGEAFCSVNGKVLCTNGLKAYCTNSAYSLKCIAGFPQKTPDCCKKDNRSLNCRASLLRCAPN